MVGVVNSEFEPPLNTSIIATLQPGDCASVVANEPMCDPRALCELLRTAAGVPSGGVRCSCIESGLRDKPGTLPDGRQCEQEPFVAMLLQSHAISITVPKPSNGSAAVQIVLRATGEHQMSAIYSASVVRRSAGAAVGAQPISSRTWRRLQPLLSFDGHHLIWSAMPPANDSKIQLDAHLKRYAISNEYALQLGLDCQGEAACVADGDTVETVIGVEATSESSSGGGMRSEVLIKTLVRSLISCDNSRAWIETDAELWSRSKTMRARFDAYDVDMLPVSYHRAPVEFRFDSLVLPQQWNASSNQYVAEVLVAGTPGLRTLRVMLTSGWDNTSGIQRDCILLERQIEVLVDRVDDSLQAAVVIGVVAGVVAFVLALCCICVKKQSSVKCLIAVVPGRALSSRTWLWGS
jgi:hypothetical protein